MHSRFGKLIETFKNEHMSIQPANEFHRNAAQAKDGIDNKCLMSIGDAVLKLGG